MKKKRYLVMMAAAACVAAVGAGSTLAYMTEKEEVANAFTVGDLDVGVRESEWDPEDDPDGDGPSEGDGDNMYPGYTVYKNPTIKNITSDENGEEPCYARMTIHIQDADGGLVEDQEAADLIKQTIRYDTTYTGSYEEKGVAYQLVQGRVPGYALEELEGIPMVNPDFELDEARSRTSELVFDYMGPDGSGILKIGEEAALFTDIVVPTDWNQTHLEKVGDFQLLVTAEAIQASGFATQTDAFHALDKEVEEGTIQTNQREEDADAPEGLEEEE